MSINAIEVLEARMVNRNNERRSVVFGPFRSGMSADALMELVKSARRNNHEYPASQVRPIEYHVIDWTKALWFPEQYPPPVDIDGYEVTPATGVKLC